MPPCDLFKDFTGPFANKCVNGATEVAEDIKHHHTEQVNSSTHFHSLVFINKLC